MICYGAKNSSQTDEFFTRGRHEGLDVYYISQSYFDLPRQSNRNNSDRLVLFKQTLRVVHFMHQDIGAFDMNYDEFKAMCRVAWGENFNYLCTDMVKKRMENIVYSTKAKTHTLNVFAKLNFLNSFKSCIQLKTEKIWKI